MASDERVAADELNGFIDDLPRRLRREDLARHHLRLGSHPPLHLQAGVDSELLEQQLMAVSSSLLDFNDALFGIAIYLFGIVRSVSQRGLVPLQSTIATTQRGPLPLQ